MDNMRGHHFAEVALFTGTFEENAVADFYNSTGVDHPRQGGLPPWTRTSSQEHKAIGVFLNPPRYWMFDEFWVFEIGDDRASLPEAKPEGRRIAITKAS